MLTQSEIDELAKKAVDAIGNDLLDYSSNQIEAFELEMGRLLKLHDQNLKTITSMECIGVHELIVDHLCPFG